jgi:hypothetical protein
MAETRWKHMHKSDSSNLLGERRRYKTSAGKSNNERRDTSLRTKNKRNAHEAITSNNNKKTRVCICKQE